ncbi:MAG TPA: DUF3987 domain-containing protein [Bosea sp. (in: a-proteobacteria)]
MSDLRARAVALAEQGFRVFPLLPGEKFPAVEGGFHQASPDPARVYRFWTEPLTGEPLNYNIGIATGNDLVVIDVDIREGKNGQEAYQHLEKQNGVVPKTRVVKTPHGLHFYLKYDDRRWMPSSAGKLGLGLDIRGDSGYVVAPGSIVKGKLYQVLVDEPIALIPEGLAQRLEATKPVKIAGTAVVLDDDALEIAKARAADWLKSHAELAIQGNGGNAAAYRVAAKLIDFGLTSDDALNLMLESDWNERCEPPWDADELQVIVNNVTAYRQNPIGSSSADVEFEDVSAEVTKAEAQARAEQHAEWPQPEDPWEDAAKNRAPPDLSEDFLPPAFQAWADDEAERKGVSRGASSSLALGMLAASISARFRVQVKQNDTGFKNRPIIWVMTVGGPGSGKSPIQSAIMEPLKKVERERHLQYKQNMQVYTAALKAGKAKSPTAVTDDPIKPRDRRRILNDATAEAVVIRESQSDHGATIVLDELDGFFGSFDAYRGGKSSKDAPFYLSAKNGDSWDVARVSRDAVGTDLHAVNIIGGIQPSVIRKTATGFGGNGMMQRFVICNMGESREAPDRAPDERLAGIVDDAVRVLSGLEPDRDAAIFKMHPEADLCRKRVTAFVRANINREGLPAGLPGWIDKLEGEWARIALILHLAEWASSSEALFDDAPLVISPETAHRAERFLLDYQWDQQRFFYEHVIGGLGANSDAPRKAAGYILTNELREISNRDLQQKALRSVENAAERAAAMVALGRAGWVRSLSLKDGKPTRWAVNPAVHDIFAARAMGEAARRFTAHNAIKEAGAARRAAAAGAA